MTATTISTDCPRCGGKGTIDKFRHVNGGECFFCLGAGQVDLQEAIARQGCRSNGGTPMVSLVVWMRGGQFDYADHRCTMLNGNNWGDPLFVSTIDDADQARAVWRQLKGLPNASLQTANIVSTDCRDDEVVHHQDWQAA
jgi:hypothetical protein